jgi:hypothetical protein
MEDNLNKNIKMEDNLKNMKNSRRPQLFFEKLEWQAPKKIVDLK